MWRRVKLSNYRSIQSVEVELEPFCVLVGPNGSGKSNFADALVFVRDIARDAASAVDSRGGIQGVRRWLPRRPADVVVEVCAAVSRKTLDTSFVRHRLQIHSGRAGAWNFSAETIEVTSLGETKALLERKKDTFNEGKRKDSKIKETTSAMLLASQMRGFSRTNALRNVRRYRLNPDLMRVPQLATATTRLEEDGSNIAVAVRSLRKSDTFDDLLTPMAKIIPGLRDIHVQPMGRYLTLKFKQLQSKEQEADFNATEMSEGALRALGIIVATLQMAKDELLIIEEPEVAIHVGAANLLFAMLKEASRRGAVLITTHSADLLDAAVNEQILVCEYDEGVTRIGPLSSGQREIVREGLFSVSELMRSEPLRIDENE